MGNITRRGMNVIKLSLLKFSLRRVNVSIYSALRKSWETRMKTDVCIVEDILQDACLLA